MITSPVFSARIPGATGLSTGATLCGLAITALAIQFPDDAIDVFSAAAIGVGLSLGIATGIEVRAGIRNLIRWTFSCLWLFMD